jgi:hypothetical protein
VRALTVWIENLLSMILMHLFWDPLYHLMPAIWASSAVLQAFLRSSQRLSAEITQMKLISTGKKL